MRAMWLVLIATVLGTCICQGGAARLSREENAAVLSTAVEDPSAFFSWAHRHNRPYMIGAPRHYLLAANLHPAVSKQLGSATPQHLELMQQTYATRQQVWLDNARYALQYNAANGASGHWLGLNGLADLSYNEYRGLLGTRVKARQHATQLSASGSGRVPGFMYDHVDLAGLPRSVDWRNASAVTPVKNQGMCGSCWAFATTGAIEGINALRTHQLLSLSEQELVDCDRDVDMGCSGGMMDNAYEWIIKNKGLATESSWPYTSTESLEGCNDAKRKAERVVTIDGYQDIPVGDEAALLKAAAHQPVAVAVEADSRAFQLYVGGVMSDPGCGDQLNHGVLVVGYGGLDASGAWPQPSSPTPPDPANGPYWIVKNSWGSTWGAEGYINLQMGFRDNTTGVAGLCGITLAASFPIKHGPNPPQPPPAPPTPTPTPAPPKPDPQPVACDADNACPPESSCCCLMGESKTLLTAHSARNSCFLWGCCPVVNAVCCDDRIHCCPATLPVCDTGTGRCLQGRQSGGSGAGGVSIPWLRNQPAVKRSQNGKPQASAS